MKLYQSFLYSIFLIVAFLFYVDIKNIEHQEVQSDLAIMKSQYMRVDAESKVLKDVIQSLQNKIIELSNIEEIETKVMIRNYIQKNFRRTPSIVAQEIATTIIQVSKEKRVAAPLLIGIIQVESEFNPYALSKAGARGLMQVMPEWIGKLKTPLEDKYDLHDITKGINAGAEVFNIHLKENKGNVNKGLWAYVNKDNTYVLKVYTAVGKYLAFSTTI